VTPSAATEEKSEEDTGHSSGLKWDKDLVKDVDKGIALSTTDPVSAVLTFKCLLDREKGGPTAKQRSWLEAQVAEYQPQALEMLRQDFAEATQANDMREMFLIKSVADQIQEEAVEDNARLAVTKSELFSGAHKGRLMWKVTQAEAVPIDGIYTEGSNFPGSMKTTLTPGPGCILIRVSATIENVDKNSDRTYALWAFNPFKRLLASEPASGSNENYRWYDDGMVAVLTPGGDIISDPYTVSGSSMSIQIADVGPERKGVKICPPEAILTGKSISPVLIFSVPQGIKGFRLWIMGAEPVPLNL